MVEKPFLSELAISPQNYSLDKKKLHIKQLLKNSSYETKSLKDKLSEKKDLIHKFKFDKKNSSTNDKYAQVLSERDSFKLKNKKSPIMRKIFNANKNSFNKSNKFDKRLNNSSNSNKIGKLLLSTFY